MCGIIKTPTYTPNYSQLVVKGEPPLAPGLENHSKTKEGVRA